MPDNGQFQLNDLVLDIPPEQIKIERRSFNHEWQTLRTKSSAKVKSGFSQLDISLTVSFTNDPSPGSSLGEINNGYRKLKDLISQFRVTPFCYVENQFLRDSILGGNTQQTMALALKQLEVSKNNDTTNVITVRMHFCWFNYKPFLKTFTYKDDLFSSIEVTNPSDSKAWKLMYRAEQLRGKYQPVDELNGKMLLEFNEFAQITVKTYQRLQKELEALRKLKQELLDSTGSSEFSKVPDRITASLAQSLGDDNWAKTLTRDIFGDTTSMYYNPDEKDVTKNVLNVLDKQITKDKLENSIYELLVNSDQWSPVILNDGRTVTIKDSPGKKTRDNSEKFDKDETVLLERKHSVNFDDAGIVTTGISISFENILATLPFLGHPFPSFQHVGSIDGRITISMMANNEGAIRKLSSIYSTLEEQARKYRLVPAGQRTLKVTNDLINLCGLHDTIVDGLEITTVPGSPGTYSAALTLVDSPLSAETTEKLSAQQSFSSSGDLRAKIAGVLEKNLKIKGDIAELSDFSLLDPAQKARISQLSKKGKFLQAAAGATIVATKKLANVLFSSVSNLLKTSEEAPSGVDIYTYTGPRDKRKEQFQFLVEEYGKGLGALVLQLVPFLEAKGRVKNSAFEATKKQFFALTNQEVPGIEKAQEDLRPIADDKETNNQTLRGAGSVEAFQGTKPLAPDTKNSLEEQNAASSNDPVEAQKKRDGLVDLQNTDAEFVNKYLGDWLSFSTAFLDRILNSDLIDLPEFQEVKEAIATKALESTVDCYPDFPLSQVISILQNDKNSSFQESFRGIQELFDKSGLGTKGIGLSAILNPDFYFYNYQNDSVDRLIPSEVINQAKESIKKSRTAMIEAEKDWFLNIYEPQVLGTQKTNRVKEDIDIDTIIAKRPGEKEAFETPAGRQWKSLVQQSFNSGIAPNDLTGYVGPSIEQAKEDGDRIEVGATSVESDKDNIQSNYKPSSVTLSGPAFSASVRHRFDTNDCLDYLPESAYLAKTSLDTSSIPSFIWPTPTTVRKPSSKFGIHRPEINSSGSIHQGVDLVSFSGPTSTFGTPVYAIADGEITFVNETFTTYDLTFAEAQQGTNKKELDKINKERKAQGLSAFNASSVTNKDILKKKLQDTVRVEITHADGWKSVYKHLQWEGFHTQYWSNIMYREFLSDFARSQKLSVRKGDIIGFIGNTGYSSGPHLHFEIRKNGLALDPEKILNGELTPSRGPIRGIDPNNESLFTKSIEQFEKELKSGQGYSMMRAYPTFKLYFIESDLGERRRFGFDDFFSYSSIKEIQVIRSRKIAADLCIIQLTNISGVLSNRKFQSALDPTKPQDAEEKEVKEDRRKPSTKDTIKENPVASLMLQPGIEVQLRLGYSNNPDELETVFNGIITDVEFTETDDLVQITCQTHAVELVQSIQGEVKDFGGFWNSGGKTGKILEELLAFPEVVHFGRWEGGDRGLNSQRGLLTNRWKLLPTPQDDNIFAPQGTDSPLGLMDALFGSTSKYVMYQTTIWDVFEEMCLRHPSYIAQAVPYEGKHGPRMTMYFGLPDQLYFARDPSVKEDNILNSLKDIVKKGIVDDRSVNTLNEVTSTSSNPSAIALEEAESARVDNKSAVDKERYIQSLSKQYAMDKGVIKPFRSYHALTSTHHILFNSLSSSAFNVFNTATVQYSKKSPEVGKNTAELEFGNADTFTLKADAAIASEEVREVYAQYPNCVGFEMAKRYCISTLFQSLKEAYKGSLVIVGNPKIKPHDICYIFDEYTDMYGPIEVEQVVHRFSQQTGFITEVTPDLVVHVNQHATLTTGDAMGLIVEHGLKKIGMESLPIVAKSAAIGAAAGLAISGPVGAATVLASYAFSPISAMFFNSAESSIGVTGSNNPFGLVGTFIFRKLIARTQLAHPFRFSPLVLNNKPMIGGLPNRKVDNSFIQEVGNWFKEAAGDAPLLIEDLSDRIKPNNWVGRVGQGDLSKAVFGIE